VRLAPVLHDGKVLVGSDDGTFRCLNLADGRVLWLKKTYPSERPNLRLLGNNRLISMWPVRGGPVVVNDIVYFGCGVWPTMGIYIHALRVADGSPVWANPQLSLLQHVRIDHNKLFDAGVSPQGYLLATDIHLVLPNGRSQPLALNRSDGSLFHFVQGYRNGDCQVTIGGDYAFVGKRGVVSLTDFREMGNKWGRAGDKAPQGFDHSRFDQFEGPYHSYKHFSGCNADSVFEGNMAYSLAQGAFYAHDLSKAAVSEWESGKVKPFRWDVPMTIRVPVGLGSSSRLFLKAGKRLYGSAKNSVLAIELTGTKPAAKIAWKHDLPAPPTSVIAAANRLFVALKDGTITCLSAEGQAPVVAAPERARAPAASAELATMLKASDARAGFCVVYGSLSTGEIDHLLTETDLRLVVVSPEDKRTEALRRTYGGSTDYGTRLEVFTGKADTFELPAYLASALWVRNSGSIPTSAALLKRLWHAVRPYGGVLCITGSDELLAGAKAQLGAAALSGGTAPVDSGGAVAVRRPNAPEGAADWTHETADAARSHFSKDTAVQAPLAPLWYGDGPDHGFFKRKDYGRGVKPQVAHGRVFALQQFSRTLYAYDAYTGRSLWKQRGEGKEAGFITRFVSRPEGVYAAGRGVCAVYDPATGRELRRMTFSEAMPADSKARAAGVVVTDTSVLIAGANVATGAIEQGLWDAEVLVCLDRKSGKIRWKRAAGERFNIKALAAHDGRVFCTDSMSPLASEYWKRRGAGVTECSSTVMALNEMTGDVLWQHQFTSPYRQHGASGWLSVRTRDDWLVCVTATNRVIAGRERHAVLLAADNGTVVWEKDVGLAQPLIIMGKHLLDQAGRRVDIETAEVLKGGLFARGGCNYAVANQHLAILRDQTVCYVDIDSGERHRLRNMRSGCSNSTIPAAGLLNIPNFAVGCVCNYPIQTSSAWLHMPGTEEWGGTAPVKVTPVPGNTSIPIVSSDVARAMHAFKRSFLVEDPEAAKEHLVGHWTFDNISADKPNHAPDLSVSKAVCTLSNPAFEPRGKGQALTCEADVAKTCGGARLPAPADMRQAFTMSAWVKLGDKQYKGAAGVFECPQWYRLMVDNTTPPYTISLSLQTAERSWRTVRTPKSLKPGEWNHVAATFDGEVGELVMYLNGKEISRSDGRACTVGPSGSGIAIGSRDGGAYLRGALDEVRLYKRALGPKAIAAIASE